MERLYKIYEINDEYELCLSIVNNYLKISIENNLIKKPRKFYSKFFTYNKLIINFTFLNQYNNLIEIFYGLNEIFNKKNYNIEMNLHFIKLNLLNKSFFIIPEIDINHNKMIKELFEKNKELKDNINKIKLLNDDKKQQLLNLNINFEIFCNNLNGIKSFPYRINNIGLKIKNLKAEEQRLIREKNKYE